jgi:hypothetical protein
MFKANGSGRNNVVLTTLNTTASANATAMEAIRPSSSCESFGDNGDGIDRNSAGGLHRIRKL